MACGTSYRFETFVLEPVQRRLLRGGAEIGLRPKTLETLVCLVERRGEAVSRDTLLSVVWPDVHVSDEVLTHCIAEVRQALGDDVRRPRFVKTLPKLGYRFIAPVVPVAEGGAAAEGTPPGPLPSALLSHAPPPPTAIVVLPFVNLSGDPDNEYLCDGLAEELINTLTKSGSLQVVAHSSSFSFKGRDLDARDIGRQLNVGMILEGSVRRTGSRIRVSAQLIDAASGYHVWAEQYDRTLGDLFAIQDEMAQAVFASLRASLPGDTCVPRVKAATSSVDAYVLYLQGRACWHQRYGGYLNRAMECFGQAIARDPGFAPAYMGLADSLSTLGIWAAVAPHDCFPKAATLANTALALDPDLADAHGSRALIRMFWDWEWEEALLDCRRGLALNPGSATIRLYLGHGLSLLGRMDEAVAEMQRAQALDPISPICSANLGFTYYLAHRHAEAIGELRRVLTRAPQNGLALFYLGWALIEVGQHDDALEAFRVAHELTGGMAFTLEGMGFAHAAAGRAAIASTILREVQARARDRYVPPSAIATLRFSLGDDEEALTCLEQSVDGRDPMLPWLKVMPCLDRLHGHPRFRAVFDRVGLR
jgi:TolB-like protein/Flp pilus assembly protein TadD